MREDEKSILPLHFEEIHDILENMLRQEATIYVRHNEVDELNGLWRRLLIGWMYYVADFCDLQRQSVGAAAFFLDVAMSHDLVHTREEYQLAAATSLQLALKTFDSAIIKLEKLVMLGKGSFTKGDIIRMEWKILKAMKWHLHPPSTYCFLQQYERLLPCDVSSSTKDIISQVTELVSELVVLDHKYNSYPPSVLAYAGMLIGMEFVDDKQLPEKQRDCFVMHMSKFAKQESRSSLLLKVCEELEDTLHASPKLGQLMQSLKTASQMVEHRSNARTKARVIPTSRQSPRHVIAPDVLVLAGTQDF